MNEQLKAIQKQIGEQGADAYVIVDYENRNQNLVKLIGRKMLTRKIVAIIPKEGKAILIAHLIDTVYLREEATTENFDLRIYKTWQEMLSLEKEALSSSKTVCMDISENGLLPRVSLADWGSVEYVRSLGLEVIPSADILQSIGAVIGEAGLISQKKANEKALKIMMEAFRLIAHEVKTKGQSDEYQIQQFIGRRFQEEGMIFDEPAIVAIGKNASDPHYGPTEKTSSPISEGDLVLIDMWAKSKEPGSVYADITWMGYVGTTVPEIYQERFNIVKAARDGVIEFLKENLPRREVEAYEADDVARRIISEAGYGEYFIHRVGHNISDDVSPHGPGANLDNYESHDTRKLLSGTSFSDEPGIYAPDFGVRSETDLFHLNGELIVTGGLQEEIVPILAL